MLRRIVNWLCPLLALALLCCNACSKHTAQRTGSPTVAQPGVVLAPYGSAATLRHDYPGLSDLPQLADLVPSDNRWGSPPQNQASPQVPLLPSFRGWCRCDTWQTEIALASKEIVLVTMWNRMTAINAASGAILWQDESSDYGHSETFVFDGLVVDQWGNYASVVKTGMRVKPSGMIMHHPDKPLPELDEGWVYSHHHRKDYNEDPLPPSELAFLAQSGLNLVGTCRVGGRLFAAAEWQRTDASATGGVSSTYVLFAFDLSPTGNLIPGKLKLVYPTDSGQAVAKFYAVADPLLDDALMYQLVADGAPAFDALLRRINNAKTPQVLALIALCQTARPATNEAYSGPPWPMAHKLLDALKQNPSVDLAPPLAVWLDTGSNPQIAQDIACLLARCGGPVAKDALLRAYDAQTFVRRTPSKPPYYPAKPNVEGGSADDWRCLVTPGGAGYIAFTDSALASWRDIYLAIDAEGDAKYEEVLFTGLGNAFYSQCFPFGWDGLQEPKGPLLLDEKEGKLVISHHEPRIRWEAAKWDGGKYKYGTITNAKYIFSTIDLAPLRMDSDQDDVPDLVEASLLLNAFKADSDSDGLPDGADSLPNLDQRQIVKLERGVQRAIILNRMMTKTGTESRERTPWDATYYSVKGCGATALSLASHGSGIYIRDADEMQRYQKLLRGSNDFSTIQVTVLDLLHLADSAQSTGMSDRTPQQWAEDPDAPQGAAYVVLLDFSGGGDYVYLVEVDGELFPAATGGSWIS